MEEVECDEETFYKCFLLFHIYGIPIVEFFYLILIYNSKLLRENNHRYFCNYRSIFFGKEWMSLKDVYLGRSNSIEIVTEDISNSTIGFTIILFFLLSAFLILYQD